MQKDTVMSHLVLLALRLLRVTILIKIRIGR